jgi:hypothetical protein
VSLERFRGIKNRWGTIRGGIQNNATSAWNQILWNIIFRNSWYPFRIWFEHFKCFEVSVNYTMIKVAEVVIMAEVTKMNTEVLANRYWLPMTVLM